MELQFLSQEKDVVQISLDCLAGTDPHGVISPFLKKTPFIYNATAKNSVLKKEQNILKPCSVTVNTL